MKCFYHHERDAIGVCKSCGRGLCPECAVEFPQGLACRARCEENVEALIRLIQNNVRLSPASSSIISASRRGGILNAGFYVVLGVMFVAWGMNSHMSFIGAMGGAFILFGIITLIRILRITPPKGP